MGWVRTFYPAFTIRQLANKSNEKMAKPVCRYISQARSPSIPMNFHRLSHRDTCKYAESSTTILNEAKHKARPWTRTSSDSVSGEPKCAQLWDRYWRGTLRLQVCNSASICRCLVISSTVSNNMALFGPFENIRVEGLYFVFSRTGSFRSIA